MDPALTHAAKLTLSPVTVTIPPFPLVRGQASLPVDPRYVFRREGANDVLYFVGPDSAERVVGDVPQLAVSYPKATPGQGFSRFVVVTTPHDTSTYATYLRFRPMLIDGLATDVSNLYVLHGREMRRVLSDLDPGALHALDRQAALNIYVDARGNVFALTSGGMLCLVRAGVVVAAADVHAVGGTRPAQPGMFSDAVNTYFIVPRLFNSENSMPVSERTAAGRYRVDVGATSP